MKLAKPSQCFSEDFNNKKIKPFNWNRPKEGVRGQDWAQNGWTLQKGSDKSDNQRSSGIQPWAVYCSWCEAAQHQQMFTWTVQPESRTKTLDEAAFLHWKTEKTLRCANVRHSAGDPECILTHLCHFFNKTVCLFQVFGSSLQKHRFIFGSHLNRVGLKASLLSPHHGVMSLIGCVHSGWPESVKLQEITLNSCLVTVRFQLGVNSGLDTNNYWT